MPGRSTEVASGKQEAVATAAVQYIRNIVAVEKRKEEKAGCIRETRAKEIHCRSDIDESK